MGGLGVRIAGSLGWRVASSGGARAGRQLQNLSRKKTVAGMAGRAGSMPVGCAPNADVDAAAGIGLHEAGGAHKLAQNEAHCK
jgi:hypothetical protein